MSHDTYVMYALWFIYLKNACPMVYASNVIYQMILTHTHTHTQKKNLCLYFVKLSYKERMTKPKILDVAFC